MPNPVIGIVATEYPAGVPGGTLVAVNQQYLDALREAGATPLILAPGTDPDEALRLMDAWMVMGGKDLDPASYGQVPHPAAEAEGNARQATERGLWDRRPPAMPLLGVCYGAQFINVMRGGTLHQHLPDRVGHPGHSGGTLQRYEVSPGSRLAELTGATVIEGKSYHHQAVDRLGDGLRIVATGPDGVVEALESTDGTWTIGVQWHPERTPGDAATRRLFLSFVAAAAKYKADRESCGTW